jgi:hypothetical protein
MGQIETVTAILEGVAVYAVVGAIFGVLFLAFGLPRVDSGSKGAGLGFRLLILPGLVALWPFMLIRWIAGHQPHG